MKRFQKVFWGVFFLLAAAFVLLSQLGVFAPGISAWKLIPAVLMLAVVIQGVVHLEFFSILVPLAGILALFAEPLGITAIAPWPILGAAVFASIGLSIIFHKQAERVRGKRHGHWGSWTGEFGEDEMAETLNANAVKSEVSFGASVKYLHAEALERARFECSFGQLRVYFDQAQLAEGGADVEIECSFGNIVLYVPRSWDVVEQVHASLGAFKSRENRTEAGAPQLRIRGDVSFGAGEIIYI